MPLSPKKHNPPCDKHTRPLSLVSLPYPSLPYPALPCPALPCPALPYPISSPPPPSPHTHLHLDHPPAEELLYLWVLKQLVEEGALQYCW